jgi:hypothetical protein
VGCFGRSVAVEEMQLVVIDIVDEVDLLDGNFEIVDETD